MHPVIANVLEIALILLIGFLARLVIVKIVKHLVRQARKPPADRGWFRRGAANFATAWAGEREAQRAAALGSLVISITSVVIGLICILGILSVLGIDLTPVLASAGLLSGSSCPPANSRNTAETERKPRSRIASTSSGFFMGMQGT